MFEGGRRAQSSRKRALPTGAPAPASAPALTGVPASNAAGVPLFLQAATAASARAELPANPVPAEDARAGSPLPPHARGQLEQAVGVDLHDVRLHSSNDVAAAHGAEAVTVGNDVHLARPMSVESGAGRHVLAHELTHVVQQRRGAAGMPPGAAHTLENEAYAIAPTLSAGGSVNVHGAAQWGAPQALVTTDGGDRLPDPILVDWTERFQIGFGVRTTGYGDVKIQYKISYLGSFTGEPSDLHFVIERDPGGPWELGKPHARRINAAIVEKSPESITLDVYGDGTVRHVLFHTIAYSPGPTGSVHQFQLEENGKWAATRNLTTLDTQGVTLSRPEGGVIGTVAPPAFKPDPKRAPQLPTGMLLDMIVGRLNAAKVPITWAMVMLRYRLAEDMQAATQAGDDEGLTRNAQRLLDLLTYLNPIFPMLDEMYRSDEYMGGLATVAQQEVSRITDLYIAAMTEAYTAAGDTRSLAAADTAMADFPNWVKRLYLRDANGVKSLIAQIPGLVNELREARRQKGTLWGTSATSEADNLVGLTWGDLAGDLERKRDSIEWDWRNERDNVLESIQSLYASVQRSIGLLTAMIWQGQLSAIRSELSSSLINSGMEATFWGERTDRAAKYAHQLQMLVFRLSGVKVVYGSGYNLTEKSDRQLIDDALRELADLAESAEFQRDLDDFATRIKWVDRIAFVGKLVLIVAAAALTGGAAGSLAFGGLRAVGAGVAFATAGELVIGGLVFTAVSRAGQEVVFGKAEGNFFVDWFWNSITLGVLKAVNYGFTGLFKLKLDPNVAKIRFALGRSTSAMISLHGIGELQHLARKGELMSGDERANAIFQNVALMVGLEAGRFITAPLEARLTQTLITKLKIDVKLAARIDALAAQRKPLVARMEALSRGEATAVEIDTTLKSIEKLWAEELKLVNDGANRKILTADELTTALSSYSAHISGMQLRLSQLGIEAPMPGGTTFRPMGRGVVAYTPEGRAALEKYYTPDPLDPATAGRSLKESTEVPGALEGRLPNGELTYYVPEGSFATGIPKAADLIAARDAAVLAAKGDPKAAEGLRRLNDGLRGGPTSKGLAQHNVDAILGSVPPELIPEFLRSMADPTFTQNPGLPFYTGLAARPAAIEFARAYGGGAVVKIWRAYGWRAFDTMLTRAQVALETAESPAARQELIDRLARSDRPALDKLLDNVKPKLPAEPAVSKKTLGVNRSSTEWQKLRNDAADFATDHKTTVPPEVSNLMADMLQIHAKAMSGKFSKWSGNQDAIENLLDRFDAMAEQVAKADPTGMSGPWARTVGNWRNSLRGAIGEAVGRPAGVPKFKGAFLLGVPATIGTKGVTTPDYSHMVGGVVEWVNIKSDLLTPGLPGSRSGTYTEGTAAARQYRNNAEAEALNIPTGDRYSIQFLRDPLRADDTAAGRRTMTAMLDTLFSAGSPISRVKFGDRPWISRASHVDGGGK